MFYLYLNFKQKLSRISIRFSRIVIRSYLKHHCVSFDSKSIIIDGLPHFVIDSGAKVTIGKNFRCISTPWIGIDNNSFTKIAVHPNATLSIGHNSGMTNSVINCFESITIGNYVNIGAGCLIVDSDFHSLDWRDRLDGSDTFKKRNKPVVIKDLAFIGARSIILKGVTIGERSIVGAGSVVSHSIPDGEIWAGNPARFIRKVN